MNNRKTLMQLTSNIYVKIGVIIILIALLLLPAHTIENMVIERQFRQLEAHNEISSKWGEDQTLTGPILTIPYDVEIEKEGDKADDSRVVRYSGFVHFLPDQLNISGDVNKAQQDLHRGMYDIVVYNSDLRVTGEFHDLPLHQYRDDNLKLHLDRAFVSLGISDLKGLEDQIVLDWNGNSSQFNSGTLSKDVVSAGMHCPVTMSTEETSSYTFSLEMNLKGSEFLYFVPVGKTTDVQLSSNWTNPSFNGAFIPDERNVSEDGFTAKWNVLHLNRNYPQSWKGKSYEVANSAFGVNLILGVDVYQKTIRVVKYALLFVTLTFLLFFFVEILNKVFIHPIQYGLVGIALVVFFTLLLSFSEHIRFNQAYLISTLLTIGLISAYVRSILKSNNLALLLSGILSTLYAFIFIIIQMQDFTLLFGSLGIFIILALTMFFSRKIDWYGIGHERLNEPEEKSTS